LTTSHLKNKNIKEFNTSMAPKPHINDARTNMLFLVLGLLIVTDARRYPKKLYRSKPSGKAKAQTFRPEGELTLEQAKEEIKWLTHRVELLQKGETSASNASTSIQLTIGSFTSSTVMEAYRTLPKGVLPPEKMVDADFTSCGVAATCKPSFKTLTRSQKYLYMGQYWQFPSKVSRHLSPRVPRVVHYIISDRRTHFFDWTCYLSVRAAFTHIKPSKVIFHIYDSVEPFGQWWEETKKLGVTLQPFGIKDVPQELNGIKVTLPAHVADLRRFQILAEQGGIYMDTDHIMLRAIDDLLFYDSVWG
jgi:hypothetical protein